MQKVISTVAWAFLFGLVGCASNPSTADRNPPESRAAYIAYAEQQIERWDDRVAELDRAERPALQAAVRDARIELRGLMNSTAANWQTYRNRLESTFDRLDRDYAELARR